MTVHTLLAALCLVSTSAFAQTFTPADAVPAEIEALPEFVRPARGQVFRIDWEALDADLARAGAESAPREEHATIELPTPDGLTARYAIVDSPILEPELAAKFPDFRTYRVQGIDDPAAVGRLDVTTHGLRAMIRTGAGAIFIDPYSAQQRDYASVYYLHDLGLRDGNWACHVGPQHGPQVAAGAGSGSSARGTLPLRTYRMAMACSGEYGAYQSFVQGHEPNQTDALAAIVTVVNRCNTTFEVDVGVRFLLVANNDLLAFFEPATDPYVDPDPKCTSGGAGDCSYDYLDANGEALAQIIGNSNFDVGHVLTRVPGGVAYLSSVCGGNKAKGVSGIPRGGEFEPVSALVPLHELGHQFGANHTFNGVLGRCNSNINGSTNWEPGGGSTLLAYPGACPVGGTVGEGDTDNLVLFADPYFHTGSVMEIRNFLGSGWSQCSQNATTDNQGAPTISSLSPSGLWIPPSTPFALSVVATDDSPSLTYCWDQFDIGPAQRLTGDTSADNGQSALFRSFTPVSSPTRIFPRMSDLLAGTSYIGERMPTFTGSTRKFRVTVRDNQGGSTTSDIVRVRIADTQPFRVLEPAGQVYGPSLTVRWNAAAISGDPINTTSVAISLSLDGGQTFPHVLAASSANSGVATFDVTGLTSDSARVKVAAVGNNFFNISGAFVLSPPCRPDFDGDGFVTGTDFDLFVAAFESGDMAADFDGDGFITGLDFDDFVYAFEDGC